MCPSCGSLVSVHRGTVYGVPQVQAHHCCRCRLHFAAVLISARDYRELIEIAQVHAAATGKRARALDGVGALADNGDTWTRNRSGLA